MTRIWTTNVAQQDRQLLLIAEFLKKPKLSKLVTDFQQRATELPVAQDLFLTEILAEVHTALSSIRNTL